MNETLVVATQFLVCAGMNTWMLVAVYDNWRHPRLNESGVAMVMQFDLMAREYPEDFRLLQHRRIDNPRIIRGVYYFLVGFETIAAIALTIGSLSLGLALFGQAELAFARSAALVGALIFSLNWTGFLIGGNYFAYWYCHFQAQATHFLLALWGIALMLLLILPQ